MAASPTWFFFGCFHSHFIKNEAQSWSSVLGLVTQRRAELVLSKGFQGTGKLILSLGASSVDQADKRCGPTSNGPCPIGSPHPIQETLSLGALLDP